MNALAAFAMADTYKIPTDKIKASLKSFKGVERRFSYRIKSDNLVLIDDYAHHPAEIRVVYQAIKEMYPKEKNMVIFQPHLFSRTQDFVTEFAAELGMFDEVRVLDIYPARELPITGVTSQWLLSEIQHQNKKLVRPSDLVKEIQNSNAKAVAMLGAGDIGKMIDNVVKELNTKEKI
jgi:UDP-N-acetylmuramate--alanine ligase